MQTPPFGKPPGDIVKLAPTEPLFLRKKAWLKQHGYRWNPRRQHWASPPLFTNEPGETVILEKDDPHHTAKQEWLRAHNYLYLRNEGIWFRLVDPSPKAKEVPILDTATPERSTQENTESNSTPPPFTWLLGTIVFIAALLT